MFKIIGGDQREYGPVSEDQILQWITEGRASRNTLAQAEGTGEWKPLSSFPEFAEALDAQSAANPLAAAAAPAPAMAGGSQVSDQPGDVSIGDCVAGGVSLIMQHAGPILGATLLVWIATTALLFIPVCGPMLLAPLLGGVIYAGYAVFMLKLIRKQEVAITDVFAGFTPQVLLNLVIAAALVSVLKWIGLACCLVIPGIYLGIAWLFALPLVLDRGMEFWPAMEKSRKLVTRRWFTIFFLAIIAYLPILLIQVFTNLRIMPAVFELVNDALTRGVMPDRRQMQELMDSASRYGWWILLTWLVNLPFAYAILMHAYDQLFQATPKAEA